MAAVVVTVVVVIVVVLVLVVAAAAHVVLEIMVVDAVMYIVVVVISDFMLDVSCLLICHYEYAVVCRYYTIKRDPLGFGRSKTLAPLIHQQIVRCSTHT